MSTTKLVDQNVLLYFWTKCKAFFATAAHGHGAATTGADGFMAAGDKTKLDGIAAGANAYTHPAHTAMASGLYRVTVDAQGHVTAAVPVVKKDITDLGVPGQDTTYLVATNALAGLLSAEDKAKLDGVAAGANAYTHPTHTAKSSGMYKITVNALGHVTAAAAITKADLVALGIPAQDTTYGPVTAEANGLMTPEHAQNLSELNTNAARAHSTEATPSNSFPDVLNFTVASSALPDVKAGDIVTGVSGGKMYVYVCTGTGDAGVELQRLAAYPATTDMAGLMTPDDKTKLDGIAANANNYAHPTHTAKSAGLYKVTVDAQGHVSAATAVAKNDITGLGIPAQDTTYSAATTSVPGLMSAADKTKLDSVEEEANNYVHPNCNGGAYNPPNNLPVVHTASSISTGTSAEMSIEKCGYSAQGHMTSYFYKNHQFVTPLATSSANGVMSAADKAKLDAFSAASAYALKSDITSMYRHKGSVAAVANLPASGNTVGDVYNVTGTGMNYVWTGEAWDALGEVFTIETITNAEIDAMMAS